MGFQLVLRNMLNLRAELSSLHHAYFHVVRHVLLGKHDGSSYTDKATSALSGNAELVGVNAK